MDFYTAVSKKSGVDRVRVRDLIRTKMASDHLTPTIDEAVDYVMTRTKKTAPDKIQMVVVLKKKGLARVLNGAVGMTFVVDRIHDNVDRIHDNVDGTVKIVHVRDYRHFTGPARPFQIWSMHLGDDCVPLDFATEEGVGI